MYWESILQSIKKLLGIPESDEAFDAELIAHINGVFMTLHQLGVGTSAGFFISGPQEIWSDFVNNDHLLETVRMFIYLKVRMIFDPPTSSAAAEAINSRIAELEFRLNVQAEGDAES